MAGLNRSDVVGRDCTSNYVPQDEERTPGQRERETGSNGNCYASCRTTQFLITTGATSGQEMFVIDQRSKSKFNLILIEDLGQPMGSPL